MTRTTIEGVDYEVCCATCGCKGITKDCPPTFPRNTWCAQWTHTKFTSSRIYQEIFLESSDKQNTLCVAIDSNEIILSESSDNKHWDRIGSVTWEYLRALLKEQKE